MNAAIATSELVKVFGRSRALDRLDLTVEPGLAAALEELLAQDVVLYTDGGGKVAAARRPINGRQRVARALSVGMSLLAEKTVRVEVCDVNGQPGGVAIAADDRFVAVMALDVADGRIQAIHSIANPDKLRHLHDSSHHGAL